MDTTRDLKENRSLLVMILLSIITFGIYELYYIHTVAKDTNTICEGHEGKTSGLFALILLSLLTCGIYGFFWWYRIGDMLAKAVHRRSLHATVSGGTVLLCFLIGTFVFPIISFVGLYYVNEALNELSADYNLERRRAPAEGTPSDA